MDNKDHFLSLAERDLLRRVFKDNDDLLKTMRALMLGLGISEGEKATIRATFGPEVIALMRKFFAPTLHRDLPLGQMVDNWSGAEGMVFGQSRDTITQAIEYKKRAIELSVAAIDLLANPDSPTVDVSKEPVTDTLGIELLTRNQFIKHVDSQCVRIKVIANADEKKEAEVIKKDSVE